WFVRVTLCRISVKALRRLFSIFISCSVTLLFVIRSVEFMAWLISSLCGQGAGNQEQSTTCAAATNGDTIISAMIQKCLIVFMPWFLFVLRVLVKKFWSPLSLSLSARLDGCLP